MKLKFLFFSLLFFATLATQAQKFTLKKWNWSDYKMSFQAPDNMEITANDDKSFGATNKLITLNIYPRKGENFSYEGMKSALMKWAVQTKLSYKPYNTLNGEKQPFYMSNLNKYTGCAIDGTKEGFPATMVLITDPDYPEISFYIWISYAQEYSDDALKILQSFKPI